MVKSDENNAFVFADINFNLGVRKKSGKFISSTRLKSSKDSSAMISKTIVICLSFFLKHYGGGNGTSKLGLTGKVHLFSHFLLTTLSWADNKPKPTIQTTICYVVFLHCIVCFFVTKVIVRRIYKAVNIISTW